ncbi:MAG: hypothetical protein L0Y71_17595, partial [Gemmataceae bacterium]|nr:hypothetical protein [Gemmataceae bacterium]
KGLRVNGPVPAGKRVTCPACQSPFVTGGDGTATPQAPGPVKAGSANTGAANTGAANAVQAKRPAPAVSKSSPRAPANGAPANAGFSTKPQAKKPVARRVDVVEEVEDVEDVDDVDEVRPRGRRVPQDDDDDRPRRRRDEDYDDDDDDDRPRRKKKQKKKAGSLGLVLGLCGGGVLLVVLVITGFVWPGFFLGSRQPAAGQPAVAAVPGGAAPAARAEPNPLAFLPGDANVVAGMNVTQVKAMPQFQKIWTSLKEPGSPLGNMSPELRNLIDTTDSFLIAGNTDRNDMAIFVLMTTQPYDPEKLKAHLGAPMSFQGQTVYPQKAPASQRVLAAMPSPKILLISQLPAEQFAALIARAGSVQLHPDLQQQVAAARTSHLWAAIRFDELIKQNMQMAMQNVGQGAPPDFQHVAGIVQRGKGVNLTMDVIQNQSLKLSVAMVCNDANDAAQVRNSMQNMWNTQGRKGLEGLGALAGPELNPLINEVTQSLAFDQRESTAAMTVQVNMNTIQQLAQGQNPGFMPFGPGGFNPPIPGFNKKGPPGFGPPGFGPGIKKKKTF